MGFSWRASSLKPHPEFKARARLQLEQTQLYAKQPSQPDKPGFFTWQRSWAFGLTAILVILFAGVGTVAASSGALPDEPLYPVKLATEQTRLALTFSDAGKAKLNTELAENRAVEIAAMAQQGRTEQAAAVTQKLAQHLEKADHAIRQVEETEVEAPKFAATPEEAAEPPEPAAAPEPATPSEEVPTVPEPTTTSEPDAAPEEAPTVPEPTTTSEPDAAPEPDTAKDGKAQRLKQSLRESTSRSLAALENAMEQAPEQAKPALLRAIDTISEKSHKKPKPVPSAEDEAKDKGKGNHEQKDKGKGNGDKDEDEPNDQDKGRGNNKGNNEGKGNGKADDEDEEAED